MCGICGFIKPDLPDKVDEHIIKRMTRVLAHRGPDDEGIFHKDNVFLGHRRLAVIDLKTGHQPMTNEDGRVVVVFNGEIYNYKVLRDQLTSKGHSFRTRSDTEVLLHLWEEERVMGTGRLNGMFAYAIWDFRDRTLFLARDRMGKKPLYWTIISGEVIFASEIRALLVHPSVAKDIEPLGLYYFLTMDYIPSPLSILKGVKKVVPGGYVLIREGQVEEGVYTDIRFSEGLPLVNVRDAQALITDTMRRAVSRRLESEVPLGVFLSGGLDSTFVLLEMSRLMPPRKIKTFTIGFNEKSFDESQYARQVAQHLGTEHHEMLLTTKEAQRIIEHYPEICDEPLADYSIVPTYYLCKSAREEITVALSGDGGDELFYGYETFVAERFAHLVRHLPLCLLKAISDLPMPVSDRDLDFFYKTQRFFRGLSYGWPDYHFAWIGGFTPDEALQLLTFNLWDIANEPYPFIKPLLERCKDWPIMKMLSYLYCKTYLCDGVLAKVDRASMACGMEVRSPFLDPEIVKLAFALPSEYSLGLWTTKMLIRRALRGHVPERIVNRPKKGFGMPISKWIREDLRGIILEHLAWKRIKKEGFFIPDKVKNIVEEHMARKRNRRKEIFNLLIFELWMSKYIL